MKSENELLDLFMEKRNSIIDRLDRKEITKEEFLEENYFLLNRLSMKPFLKIDNISKGIYNYQYYNILAKYHGNLANDYKNRDKKKYKKEINKINNYYYEKDKIIIKILDIDNYENIESYYIKMHSTRLNNNLFEIVITNREKAIFHSMNIEILKKLKENKVFIEETKLSKIDEYVNSGI